jgi:rhodanese-related sulfurtransferase
MFFGNLFSSAPRGYDDVDCAWVRDHTKQVRMIDVREPDEWVGDLGHVAGAELVPLATLAEKAKAWSREQEIVVICRSGGRSARGAGILASMGFTKLHNMSGGMMAWNASGLPTAKR